MVEKVDSFGSDFLVGEGVVGGDFERFRLDPFTLFPIKAGRGDLADVDLRVEVGGKRKSVVTGVCVDDVDGADLGEKMLQGVSTEDIGNAGIES